MLAKAFQGHERVLFTSEFYRDGGGAMESPFTLHFKSAFKGVLDVCIKYALNEKALGSTPVGFVNIKKRLSTYSAHYHIGRDTYARSYRKICNKCVLS